MYTRIVLCILFCSAVGQAMAQQGLNAAVRSLSSSATATGKVYYADRNAPPRAITFNDGTVATTYFLANINHYFDIPAEFTFTEVASNTDDIGMRHRVLQQYYEGIPLEGMGYRVHERNGFVTSANGRAVREINVETQSTIGEEHAFHLAVRYLGAKDSVFRPGRKLIVSKGFTFTPESFSVAYQFDVDVSIIEQWRVSIDARSGQLLNKVSLVNSCGTDTAPPLPYGTGTGMTNYYGSQTIRVEEQGSGSRLHGQTENGGHIATYNFDNVSILSLTLFYEFHKAYDFYSSTNIFNSTSYKPGVSVQWAAEQAYEYYYKEHNRNSFDNNGATIRSYVHVDKNLNNAYWLGQYNLLVFGDGNNDNPLVELDVVSHELTHGVTQYEQVLEYANESGALNESFSDILGKAVEFYTFGDTATWQMARHNQLGGLRDLSNPNLKAQPDTYLGDMWYSGIEDAGGVHTNSGVQNFWFYLLCEGGSGVNDHGLNYSVNPIGMDVAVKIAYRNLTEYMGPQSDYLDSRIGSLLAAADLYGKDSEIYEEVDKAWDAVGVTDEPFITNLEVYDITGTTAMLRANLEPRGNGVIYQFEYGTTPALGSSIQFQEYTGTVSGMLSELQSETKYYVRLRATNENGSAYAYAEFTTISLAPLVKIKPTVDVTETTAVVYGEVNPNNLSTTFYFEYGPTPALGLVTPTIMLSDGVWFQSVSATLTDLEPRQTYYYRLVATNNFASSPTPSLTFFTAVKPLISSFSPATAMPGTEVTITGQHFNTVAERNLVNFGATRAVVLSSTATELKVKVPAGASFGPLSLLDTESGLATESVKEFVPTYTGEFKKSSLQHTVGMTDNIYQTLVHDMDGDGKPDLVARHYLGFSVFLNVNTGGDVIESSFIRNTFNVDTPSRLFLVDLDGNGLKDVVAFYHNVLRIYPNLSVAGYVFFGTPVDVAVDNWGDLAFSDFDLDGHIDIAVIHPGWASSTLTITRNKNPTGTLSADNFKQKYTRALPYYVRHLIVSDLNNDGAPDLIAELSDNDYFPMLINHSNPGTFQFEEDIVQDPTRGRFASYAASDLNQDGWKDIISLSYTPIETFRATNLSILENGNTPDITLLNPELIRSGQLELTFQPGDVNGDGKVDLLIGFRNRLFTLLQNKTEPNEPLSMSSFEQSGEYGQAAVHTGSGTVQSRMIVNDLNGDGRPEIIRTNSYSYGPHDGYTMEIWQNAISDCVDPSGTSIVASNRSAKIILPANTTFDQFEIDYRFSGYDNWSKVSSAVLSGLYPGYSYQLRIRARCYLGFSAYHYIDFIVDCVDPGSFTVTNIDANSVTLQATNLLHFEVQYSPTGKNQWETATLNNYSSGQIMNLMPGTVYDLRYRGRCDTATEFNYLQFTTHCPILQSITIPSLAYNKAVVQWRSNYTGYADLEYSDDNILWNPIDESLTLFPLISGTEYFIRGRMACTDVYSDFIYRSFITPCAEVSLMSAENLTPFSARIHWVDESEADAYVVRYSRTPGGPIIITETSSPSIELDGLNAGTEYRLSVAPKCGGLQTFTTFSFHTACYAPVDLAAIAVTHTTAELTWSDEFGGLPYAVDYSILGDDASKTMETETLGMSLADLRPGTTYLARVHVACPSTPAPIVSVQFTTELYGNTLFAPNPTPNRITIYPSENLIGNRFSIVDNTGRILIDAVLSDYTIDLSGFPAGVYILMVDGEKPLKILKY